MTARPPCPVCGVPVAVAASGTLAFHRRPVLRSGVPGFAACPGSGALAPAGDLLGAPLAVEAPERLPCSCGLYRVAPGGIFEGEGGSRHTERACSDWSGASIRPPHNPPAFQLDAFNLDLFGGSQS